jgi:hypothetical protein
VVRSVWVVGEAGGQVVDVGGDVVADESHAVDAVDAALGGWRDPGWLISWTSSRGPVSWV